MTKQRQVSVREARALAASWEVEYAESQRSGALMARFQSASANDVIKMWETGTNEHGRKLSQFEFGALIERWCELFGTLPPDDGEEPANVQSPPTANEPEPEDDTMLPMREVVRLTGLSDSTIKRMVLDGRFPPPMRLSPRRIGWLARDVKAWIRQLDDQRRAPRQ